MKREWTKRMEAELRDLWARGKSASQIAKAMGDGLTRNSIIGKAHRLKLPDRRVRLTPEQRARAAAQSKARYRAKMRALNGTPRRVTQKRSRLGNAVFTPQPAFPIEKPKGEAWKPIEGTTPVSLVNLEKGQCKWPVTEDSPFLFCGAHATHGPYCQHHHLWSIGQGTATERAAVDMARHAAFRERFVFEEKEAA